MLAPPRWTGLAWRLQAWWAHASAGLRTITARSPGECCPHRQPPHQLTPQKHSAHLHAAAAARIAAQCTACRRAGARAAHQTRAAAESHLLPARTAGAGCAWAPARACNTHRCVRMCGGAGRRAGSQASMGPVTAAVSRLAMPLTRFLAARHASTHSGFTTGSPLITAPGGKCARQSTACTWQRRTCDCAAASLSRGV